MHISWVVLHMWKFSSVQFSSVQFTHSVMSNSLQPHGLRHARPPCPPPSPEPAQTHVHRVSDAIQPSHPRSSPSSPASRRRWCASSGIILSYVCFLSFCSLHYVFLNWYQGECPSDGDWLSSLSFMRACVLSNFSRVWLFVTLWTVIH